MHEHDNGGVRSHDPGRRETRGQGRRSERGREEAGERRRFFRFGLGETGGAADRKSQEGGSGNE